MAPLKGYLCNVFALALGCFVVEFQFKQIVNSSQHLVFPDISYH